MQIVVEVQGAAEVATMFRLIGNNLMSRVVMPYIDDHTEMLRTEMQKRQHVASGAMKRSTVVTGSGLNKQVIVGVSYGEEENQRPGMKVGKKGTGRGTPHQFVEPAIITTNRAMQNRLEQNLIRFLQTV